jgi:hypothetical protein
MIGFHRLWLLADCLALAAAPGFQPAAESDAPTTDRPAAATDGAMRFQLSSPSFTDGQTIPTRHTCDGPDVSPPLAWGAPPPATKGFALVCDDPDAPMGTWVHWVIFNIPVAATSLPENVAKTGELPDGARQGTNSFRRVGYGGPCPPHGPAHRYYFKLFALSEALELPAGCTVRDLEKAMGGRVLASAQLMGRYARRL